MAVKLKLWFLKQIVCRDVCKNHKVVTTTGNVNVSIYQVFSPFISIFFFFALTSDDKWQRKLSSLGNNVENNLPLCL